MRERARQDEKWGANRFLDDLCWLAVLTEELGEVAKAILEQNTTSAPNTERDEELTQVAAVAIAWLDCINRRAAGVAGPCERSKNAHSRK